MNSLEQVVEVMGYRTRELAQRFHLLSQAQLVRAKTKLLVNATAVGMAPGETPVPGELLPPDLFVIDLIYNPPVTQLLKDAQTLKASGTPAYSIGGADGWTLTDMFENIYLRTFGAAKYDQLSQHKIKWTDPSVATALTTMAKIVGVSSRAG